MIIEVNDAGEILVPAELVQAASHTRLHAGRNGDAVVLRPLGRATAKKNVSLVDSLPTLDGDFTDPTMTFGREDIYGPDCR